MIITADEVFAAAGVDPRELRALLMAGHQDRTIVLSRAFEEASRSADEAYVRARRAHAGIAGSYTDNGGAVLDVQAAVGGLARYEHLGTLLNASAVPLGTDFATAAGQQAITTSQTAKQILGDPLLGTALRQLDPTVIARVEDAGRGSSQVLSAVSHNLDSAQHLVGDRATRHSLLLTPISTARARQH